VHTYHGHVLSGYFGPAKTEVFRRIEQGLARRTDCLIGLSQATVDELVAINVAPRERFRTIPTGLDLAAFLAVQQSDGCELRAVLGVEDDELLAAFVGRLAPIKRVDILLRAVAHARGAGARIRLAVVGDGELRETLEAHAAELGLSEAVTFLGFRRDLPQVAAACDLAVLSSDNEGIPVALIEAAAAGKPAIGTDVGGVSDVVPRADLVPAGDHRALGERLIAATRERAALPRKGEAARARVRETFAYERLLRDIAALYDELLAARAGC
jgi:glycosyltransferase involved in cell wall biosynthesis